MKQKNSKSEKLPTPPDGCLVGEETTGAAKPKTKINENRATCENYGPIEDGGVKNKEVTNSCGMSAILSRH